LPPGDNTPPREKLIEDWPDGSINKLLHTTSPSFDHEGDFGFGFDSLSAGFEQGNPINAVSSGRIDAGLP
jgi:hypothetical protein